MSVLDLVRILSLAALHHHGQNGNTFLEFGLDCYSDFITCFKILLHDSKYLAGFILG